MSAPPATPALLDPRLLGATRGLVLQARRLVAGAFAGQHASRRPGVAREFSQFRAYQPGDETRHLDWKLFARSDRYFVRESEVDTRVALGLVLDATASMEHRDGSAAGPRKLDRARALAAAFAYLAEVQGDAATLHVVQAGGVASRLTAGGREPFQAIVHALAPLAPAGRWPGDPRSLAQAIRRAELEGSSTGPGTAVRLTVVFTDGHEPDGEIRAALAPLRAGGHELILLHFVARDEREFPWRGPVRFEEWETGRTLETDASAARAAYLAAEQRARLAWARAWNDDGFDYLTVMSDEAMHLALRSFLRRRRRR